MTDLDEALRLAKELVAHLEKNPNHHMPYAARVLAKALLLLQERCAAAEALIEAYAGTIGIEFCDDQVTPQRSLDAAWEAWRSQKDRK